MSYRPASRQNDRAKTFKKLQSDDDARRKRGEHLVEIRKNKRAEELQKKRREGEPQEEIADNTFLGGASSTSQLVAAKLEGLPHLVTGVCSDDTKLQLEATTHFRKLLSIERSPPIEEVIKANVVPRFVQFLQRHDSPQLQFEAAW
eukprot:1461260-Pyramimonas_sp.AAC.1